MDQNNVLVCIDWNSTIYIIGSDNGLSPGRRQAIIWTYALYLPSPPRYGVQQSDIVLTLHLLTHKLCMSAPGCAY